MIFRDNGLSGKWIRDFGFREIIFRENVEYPLPVSTRLSRNRIVVQNATAKGIIISHYEAWTIIGYDRRVNKLFGDKAAGVLSFGYIN